MKLSVILPTIRMDKIETMYTSFLNSFSEPFEFIIISPYAQPDFLKGKDNVKYFQDWGSPLRCQQIGLCNATGDYIHRAVDDSLYIPNMFNKAFELLKDKDYKTMVNLKFWEGQDLTHRNMADPALYHIRYHLQSIKLYTPFDFQILNFSIIPLKLMREIGGWNTQRYETIAFGELDLSLRLQFYGAKPILTENIVLKCDWIPGESGDHAPMHHAFQDDAPKYAEIYNKPECEIDLIIDIRNYINAPKKWERRFK